jgi:predicted nucleic acid-binding Zn ribbon protein
MTAKRRICLGCGGSMKGRRRDAKTCSDKCRQRLHRVRKNEPQE